MKRYEKIILIALLIMSVTALVIVIPKDYKAKAGAFATSSKKAVYLDLTAAADESVGLEVDFEQTTENEAEQSEGETTEEAAAEGTELPDQSEDLLPEDWDQAEAPVEHAVPLETEAPVDYNDGVYRGDIYQVCGVELDPEIGDFLVRELQAHDIEWWLPYALAQMFQESRFEPRAANKNGLDKGILQYRVTYWDWSRGDIFDYKAQIRLYVEQTARRLASGCSIWETVSRHNTSDYGTYNAEYVAQVFQWIPEE